MRHYPSSGGEGEGEGEGGDGRLLNLGLAAVRAAKKKLLLNTVSYVLWFLCRCFRQRSRNRGCGEKPVHVESHQYFHLEYVRN